MWNLRRWKVNSDVGCFLQHKASQLMELFESLLETEVGFIAPYVKDMVMFSLEVRLRCIPWCCRGLVSMTTHSYPDRIKFPSLVNENSNTKKPGQLHECSDLTLIYTGAICWRSNPCCTGRWRATPTLKMKRVSERCLFCNRLSKWRKK